MEESVEAATTQPSKSRGGRVLGKSLLGAAATVATATAGWFIERHFLPRSSVGAPV
jgi:hypothetical protein